MDALVIVGNRLETSLSRSIAENAMKKGILIVEINGKYPVLTKGRVRYVLGEYEDVLTKIATTVKKHNKGSSSHRYGSTSKFNV